MQKFYKYSRNVTTIKKYGNNFIRVQTMNVQRNRADQLDLLELILALNEVQVTQNIIYEIQDILRYIVY